MSGPPFHILAKPEDIAKYVIAVGDPSRVELLSTLLGDTRIVNTHRGLLTVTGKYRDVDVTLATHGMGCPSASIVFEELGMLGAKYITRLGTTGGMKREMHIGDIVVATGAVYTCGGCGLGQYMPGICAPTSPDPELTCLIMKKLREIGVKYYAGPVYSSDAFYAEDPEFTARWSTRGVVAVEMEAAALFALGWMRGWRTATVLVVSDNLLSEKKEFATTKDLKNQFLVAAKVILDTYHDIEHGRK